MSTSLGPEQIPGANFRKLATKRKEEVRELIDRIGSACERAGVVNRTTVRDAVDGEWDVWRRLVELASRQIATDSIQYGRQRWPKVMEVIEMEVSIRRERGFSDDDESTLMRNSLTVSQKLMVCLRRIAKEQNLDLRDTWGNDARCVRFVRKMGGKPERSFSTDRPRTLLSEVARLNDLRTRDGASLRKAAIAEARALLAWVEEQPYIEAQMSVPAFGDGLYASQMKALVVKRLVDSKADDAAFMEQVGIKAISAKHMAAQFVAGSGRQGDASSSDERISAAEASARIEQGELQGRYELATAMQKGQTELGDWIARTADMAVHINARTVRYVTADMDEAKQALAWFAAPLGPGTPFVEVQVWRKDDGYLAEGFVTAVRKTLGLEEKQVRMKQFTFKSDAARINAQAGKIVIRLEVNDPAAVGRIRGMYKLARSTTRGGTASKLWVRQVPMESWAAVVETMDRARATQRM